VAAFTSGGPPDWSTSTSTSFTEPDLMRIQDRDLAQLPAAAMRQVRRAQRQYVEI